MFEGMDGGKGCQEIGLSSARGDTLRFVFLLRRSKITIDFPGIEDWNTEKQHNLNCFGSKEE